MGPTCHGTVPQACELLSAGIVTDGQEHRNIEYSKIVTHVNGSRGKRERLKDPVYIKGRNPLIEVACNFECKRCIFIEFYLL